MNTSIHRLDRKLWAAVLIFFLGSLSLAGVDLSAAAARMQAAQHNPSKAKNAKPSPINQLHAPFKAGEKLNYQAGWSVFTSGATVQLSIPEQRDFYSNQTWHFQANIHSLGRARNLFPIDDEFDSYTDVTMGRSRQFESYLNEMGRPQRNQVLYFILDGEASKAPGPGVIVLPGTLDPLGALYALRTIDWQKTPEWRAPVYDGHNVYELRATQEVASENVSVAAGNFSATRVALKVFQHGKEMTGIDFSAWIAQDPARTPVLMQAELEFGSVRVELISASQ